MKVVLHVRSNWPTDWHELLAIEGNQAFDYSLGGAVALYILSLVQIRYDNSVHVWFSVYVGMS